MAITVKYEGSVPKTLKAYCDRHPERVKAIGPLGDQPGYDALLRPGWRKCDDLVHSIMESNATDTLNGIKWAVPCDCAECLELIQKETDDGYKHSQVRERRDTRDLRARRRSWMLARLAK